VSHLRYQAGVGVRIRVGGEHPLDFAEKDQQIGVDEIRYQRREAVVVPVDLPLQFLDGNHVVLVHHRHGADLEECLQGVADVEVSEAALDVAPGDQDLGDHNPLLAEPALVDSHELRLAQGREHLAIRHRPCVEVIRASGARKRLFTRRHSARGDQEHVE